nr:uncharacterized protein LOC113810561 [Penaeus vannamei]
MDTFEFLCFNFNDGAGRACVLLLLLAAGTPRPVVAELSRTFNKCSSPNVQQRYTVDCGSYELHPGHILNIKGSSKPCAWTFTGPEGSKVEAACSDVSIPKTRRCNTAALMVSTRGRTRPGCAVGVLPEDQKTAPALTISSAPEEEVQEMSSPVDVFLRPQ